MSVNKFKVQSLLPLLSHFNFFYILCYIIIIIDQEKFFISLGEINDMEINKITVVTAVTLLLNHCCHCCHTVAKCPLNVQTGDEERRKGS